MGEVGREESVLVARSLSGSLLLLMKNYLQE